MRRSSCCAVEVQVEARLGSTEEAAGSIPADRFRVASDDPTGRATVWAHKRQGAGRRSARRRAEADDRMKLDAVRCDARLPVDEVEAPDTVDGRSPMERPSLYRRYLTMFLDGVRADWPRSELPVAPYSVEQTHTVMSSPSEGPSVDKAS
jgi:hypothetical protein